MMRKINCFRCEYFFTTWNPQFPRGCRAYGFKTREMPSILVKKTTGTECLQYKPKAPASKYGNQSKGFSAKA